MKSDVSHVLSVNALTLYLNTYLMSKLNCHHQPRKAFQFLINRKPDRSGEIRVAQTADRCCSLGAAASETGTFVGYEGAADVQRQLAILAACTCSTLALHKHTVKGGRHIENYAERPRVSTYRSLANCENAIIPHAA